MKVQCSPFYKAMFGVHRFTYNKDRLIHDNADPEVTSSIPAWFHTFVRIDYEIISTVILLLPLIQEGLLSVTSEVLVNRLVKLTPKKSVVR